MHPKHLFNTGTTTAELVTNHGDRAAYVEGFLDAAHELASTMRRNEAPIDIVIYPALYMYRHGLELGFKALLATYHYEFEHEDKAFWGHSLGDLWQELRPLMEPIDVLGFPDEAAYFEGEAIQYIGECVKVIHSVDPNGEHARYDTDRAGGQTLRSVRRVNLDIFEDMCKMTALWMNAVLSQRVMVDNFLRHRRGFFDRPKS